MLSRTGTSCISGSTRKEIRRRTPGDRAYEFLEITSLGNSGILLRTSSVSLAIDPYFPDKTGENDVSTGILSEIPALAGFLISHDHWDHFDPEMVALLARRHGAAVIGPGPVMERLRSLDPELKSIRLQPPLHEPGFAACFETAALNGECRITAFRTPHGRVHVSFLVEVPEGRLFFDCDNHEPGTLPLGRIKPVDALFLYPWKGSGWRAFIGDLAPSVWFPVHLSAGEMEEYRSGRLPSCLGGEPLPAETLILEPGETRYLK
ncbi:MAG: MBL fold metallo-hydrolase [Spirochaetales bacterium]|nr:MAG: MBL fold metallo-hydrolase [Spirochaetales bacterium]